MITKAQTYFNLAFEAEMNNEFGKALKFYSQALQHDKNFAMAYINRGNVYLRLRELEKAQRDHQLARKINPALAIYYH